MNVLAHRALRHDPHVEQRHVIEVFRHGRQVVMHADDRLAARAQFAQHLDDGAFGRGIHAGERFVHQVQIRVLRERTGEEDALLLAAGKLADLPGGVVGQTHLGERRAGLLPLFAASRADTSQACGKAPSPPPPAALTGKSQSTLSRCGT